MEKEKEKPGCRREGERRKKENDRNGQRGVEPKLEAHRGKGGRTAWNPETVPSGLVLRPREGSAILAKKKRANRHLRGTAGGGFERRTRGGKCRSAFFLGSSGSR